MIHKHLKEDFDNMLNSLSSERIKSADNIIRSYGLDKKLYEFRKVSGLLYTNENNPEAQIKYRTATELLLKSIENYLYPPDYSSLNQSELNELLLNECSFTNPRQDRIAALVKAGADIYCLDETRYTAFQTALIYFNDNGLCEYFMQLGIDPNYPYLPKQYSAPNHHYTLWHHALHSYCNEDILWMLIKYGAKVSDTDNEGNNALILTANKKNISIQFTEYLIHEGLDPNHRNNNGETALHGLSDYQIEKGDILYQKMELLLRSGANPNLKNNAGNSILHLLMKTGFKVHAAELVLNFNANINEKDASGFTPIYLAFENRNPALMALLISNGADTEIKYANNFTIYQLALRMGYIEEAKTIKNEAEDDYKNNLDYYSVEQLKTDILNALKSGKSWNSTDREGWQRIFYQDENFYFGYGHHDYETEDLKILTESEVLNFLFNNHKFYGTSKTELEIYKLVTGNLF